jgi:hypothetical protein
VEKTVEQRLERVEVQLEHVQADVSEMKVEVRRLGDKIDGVGQKLTDKIDGVDHKLTGKIDGLVQAISDLKVGRAWDRVWWLLMAAALLGVMARGFKWL